MKQLIDIDTKGNVVRFYLGEKTEKWGWTDPNYKDGSGKTPEWLSPSDRFYGDDWNDSPYEHNAGPVYPWFVKGTFDISFPFDSILLEPKDGELNSEYCKDDLVDRKAPVLLVISKEAQHKLADNGNGHETWAYCDNFRDAREFIAEWEHSHGQFLDGVSMYYLGDVMEAQ